jgi:hypothetical protein
VAASERGVSTVLDSSSQSTPTAAHASRLLRRATRLDLLGPRDRRRPKREFGWRRGRGGHPILVITCSKTDVSCRDDAANWAGQRFCRAELEAGQACLVLSRALPDTLFMPSKRLIEGKLRQYDEPDWTALQRLVEMEVTGDFMWMHEIALSDGTAVHAYKHCWTRRSLHLGDDGRAFSYVGPSKYREVEPGAAFERVFEGTTSPTIRSADRVMPPDSDRSATRRSRLR